MKANTTDAQPAVTGGELEGIHNSTTSVNYLENFNLNATVGDTVIATFHLIGGSTFKISGILFCAK